MDLERSRREHAGRNIVPEIILGDDLSYCRVDHLLLEFARHDAAAAVVGVGEFSVAISTPSIVTGNPWAIVSKRPLMSSGIVPWANTGKSRARIRAASRT